MSPDGLPHDLGRLFSDGAADRVLDVDLPAGRLVVPENSETGTAPAYWLSDEPSGPQLWVRLHAAHARSGLWPVFATPFQPSDERPWASGGVAPESVASIDGLNAAQVLDDLWREYVDDGDYERSPELEPFGRSWPGLAPATDGGPDPDQFADQYVLDNDDGRSRIMLVPAARSADVVTALGWLGAANYTEESVPLSSVLRSWEDRFGARLIELSLDTLHLAVAGSPVTAEHAERVGAEHFAFCPDNIMQGEFNTIREYAANEIRGKAIWSFWWD